MQLSRYKPAAEMVYLCPCGT